MPELPEVETIRRGLAASIENATIKNTAKFCSHLRYEIPMFALNDVKISAIRRRAKYLIFELDNEHSILSHLGMTGNWHLCPLQNESELKLAKHDHVLLTIEDAKRQRLAAIYNDIRRFGFLHYEKTADIWQSKFLAKLGIEPLGQSLTGTYLYNKFCTKNLSFKAALLDQTIIAGLGNIYVCEALWRSRISPFAKVNEFCRFVENSAEKLQILCDNIKDILNEALAAGGSTLKDYKKTDGTKGYFQHKFAVYGKVGASCLRCEDIIAKTSQHGRSSFFCPTCQTLLNKEI